MWRLTSVSLKTTPTSCQKSTADMVRHHVAVIVVPGSALAVHAAKAATKTTPIVFMNASDPVQSGLVTSSRIKVFWEARRCPHWLS
jgi:ABC-type uncharacterized transport system substrate-binding protein